MSTGIGWLVLSTVDGTVPYVRFGAFLEGRKGVVFGSRTGWVSLGCVYGNRLVRSVNC